VQWIDVEWDHIVQVLPLLYHLENGMLEVLPLDLKDKERAERKERFKTGFAGVL
jgi:hypothetical protein